MVAALGLALAHTEATVCVPAYYSSMTVVACSQGLLLFGLVGQFRPWSAALFLAGLALCLLSMALIGYARRRGAPPPDPLSALAPSLLTADDAAAGEPGALARDVLAGGAARDSSAGSGGGVCVHVQEAAACRPGPRPEG